MKKFLLIIFAVFSITASAQTIVNLSGLNQNTTLGTSCEGVTEHFKTTGDLNLNGFVLKLQNATLEVMGNINGSGMILHCGNSLLCGRQSIQNNPQIQEGLNRNCSALSLVEYTPAVKYSYNSKTNILIVNNAEYIKIYDLSGRLLKESNSNTLYDALIQNGLYLVKTNVGNLKLYK